MTADLFAFLAATFLLGFASGVTCWLFARPRKPRVPGRVIGHVVALEGEGRPVVHEAGLFGPAPAGRWRALRVAFGAQVYGRGDAVVCEVRAVRGVKR